LPPEFRKHFRLEPEEASAAAATEPRSENLPPFDLLIREQGSRPDERTINQTAGLIEKTLAEFGIPAKVTGVQVGPTITQFAVAPGFLDKERPAAANGGAHSGASGAAMSVGKSAVKDGCEDAHAPEMGESAAEAAEAARRMKVRVAQISALGRDLALALSAERLRIEAPVPGRPYVGIEVPNPRAALVRMRPILESDVFAKALGNAPLAVALGRDVSGQPVVADLAKMPHLLIAGTTGSGKSVCIEALTTCLAMNNTPDDLRLVMIDPKMVELVRFNGLPHLFGKVETDVERIQGVLRWTVAEMERRYKVLEASHSRNLESYNRKARRRKDEPSIPRIVVLIDELADLMMSAPDQTEHTLVRLAQMARAVGIHLVVATQRPGVEVVTGLIKANFPSRISFAVASSIDSRVILDTVGAENLLGRGDMLYLPPDASGPQRLQGVLVTDREVDNVINFWQKRIPPNEQQLSPWDEMIAQQEVLADRDNLVEQAIQIVRQERRAGASLLQRRLRIGYPRAARLMDELEELGVIAPSEGGRDWDVLVERDEAGGSDEDA
jgi:S-DNA-T family DNA segregation ATPase FtsK/SpoIIIE